MRILLIIAAVLALIVLHSSMAFAATEAEVGPHGPAPYSGDGISDGSGMDDWLNGGPGPAPNAGDGVPDGSGF